MNAAAYCVLEDPASGQQVMTLPVSYVPTLDIYSIHCMLAGANYLLGDLSPSYLYNLRYV